MHFVLSTEFLPLHITVSMNKYHFLRNPNSLYLYTALLSTITVSIRAFGAPGAHNMQSGLHCVEAYRNRPKTLLMWSLCVGQRTEGEDRRLERIENTL